MVQSIAQQVYAHVSAPIAQAIKVAAANTGVDFSYLMNKASQESSFNPNAKASTSSATGLFQFTKQTWLQMLKHHGADHGLAAYADQIQIDKNGIAHVSDPAAKKAILDLRKDPQISAEMAGELDQENKATLQRTVGGKIGPTELYLAHFLGAGGATDFIKTMRADPHVKAAAIMPEAASANSPVFYGKNGEAKTLGQIYQHFAQKFDHAPINEPAMMMAEAPKPIHYDIGGVVTLASANSAYTLPPVAKSLPPQPSSLIATMILAQMDVGAKNDKQLS